MTATTTNTVTLASERIITPIFFHSEDTEAAKLHGWNTESQEFFINFAGKIVALTDEISCERIYADDSTTPLVSLYAWVRNENTDAVAKGMEHAYLCKRVQCHESVYVAVRGDSKFYTKFRVDAPMKERVAFQIWWRNTYAKWQAKQAESVVKNRYLGFLRDQWEKTVHPKPVKGSKWRVTAGRKYPKGKTGVLFWEGRTRFGPSYGLAWSDKRGPDGKFTDVGFVSPHNLEYVPSDTDAETLERLKQEASLADAVATEHSTAIYSAFVDAMPQWDFPTAHPSLQCNQNTMDYLGVSVRLGSRNV